MVAESSVELFGHQTKHHVTLHIIMNRASLQAWWWQHHAVESLLCSRLLRVEGKSECIKTQGKPDTWEKISFLARHRPHATTFLCSYSSIVLYFYFSML